MATSEQANKFDHQSDTRMTWLTPITSITSPLIIFLLT